MGDEYEYECREIDGSPMPEHVENSSGSECRRCGAELGGYREDDED